MARKVFINYRRQGTLAVAGRISERLKASFGAANVFTDFENIPAGVDFSKYIEDQLEASDVVLAIVGENWLNAKEKAWRFWRSRRRIDNPSDWVRIEIATAIRRNIPILPVLIDGTYMPDERQLPQELRPFARRQAIPLRNMEFNTDYAILEAKLRDLMAADVERASTTAVESAPVVRRQRMWSWVAAGAVGTAVASGSVIVLQPQLLPANVQAWFKDPQTVVPPPSKPKADESKHAEQKSAEKPVALVAASPAPSAPHVPLPQPVPPALVAEKEITSLSAPLPPSQQPQQLDDEAYKVAREQVRETKKDQPLLDYLGTCRSKTCWKITDANRDLQHLRIFHDRTARADASLEPITEQVYGFLTPDVRLIKELRDEQALKRDCEAYAQKVVEAAGKAKGCAFEHEGRWSPYPQSHEPLCRTMTPDARTRDLDGRSAEIDQCDRDKKERYEFWLVFPDTPAPVGSTPTNSAKAGVKQRQPLTKGTGPCQPAPLQSDIARARKFLAGYADGKMKDEAKTRLDALLAQQRELEYKRWEATKSGTRTDVECFEKEFPEGENLPKARLAIEDHKRCEKALADAGVQAEGKRVSSSTVPRLPPLRAYLAQAENTVCRSRLSLIIQQEEDRDHKLWKDMDKERKGTTDNYQSYLKAFPNGLHKDAANAELRDITSCDDAKSAAGERVQRSSRKFSSKSGDSKLTPMQQLSKYLTDFPAGRCKTEIAAMIASPLSLKDAKLRFANVSGITDAKFTPDGNGVLVLSHKSNEIARWDLASNTITRIVPPSTDAPIGVLRSLSPDGRLALEQKTLLRMPGTADTTVEINLRDAQTLAVLRSISDAALKSKGVKSARWSPNSRYLAITGGTGDRLFVVDVGLGRVLRALSAEGKEANFTDVSLSNDGQWAVALVEYQGIARKTEADCGAVSESSSKVIDCPVSRHVGRLWNVRSGELVRTFQQRTEQIEATREETVETKNGTTVRAVKYKKTLEHPVSSLELSGNGHIVFVSYGDNSTEVRWRSSNTVIHKLNEHSVVALGGDGLYYGSSDTFVPNASKPKDNIVDLSAAAGQYGMALAVGERHLVGNDRKFVRVFDLTTRQPLAWLVLMGDDNYAIGSPTLGFYVTPVGEAATTIAIKARSWPASSVEALQPWRRRREDLNIFQPKVEMLAAERSPDPVAAEGVDHGPLRGR